MKAYIIIFIVVLAISCWANGGSQPYPYPVGFTGVGESGFSVKREAGLIPEIDFVDKPRQAAIMTKIDEKSDDQIIDFPMAARN